jgi:hypothetical protein
VVYCEGSGKEVSMDFKIQAEVILTEDRIASILIGAMEGGSNYWIDWISEQPYRNTEANNCLSDYELVLPIDVVIADTDSERHQLTVEKLQSGLEVMAKEFPFHWNNLVSENDDADTSDVLLQLSLFGELVYC